MLDLRIKGGTIVDGTGAPRFQGDIGIRDGRIVAIGKVDEPAAEEIDASGRIVAPGFIDPHTHYDAQVFWDPTLSPSCYHGVTTVFGGFCGFSIAPLSEESRDYLRPMLARVEGMPEESLELGVPWNWSSFADYLAAIEGTLAINAGFMAGHTAIRRFVMGARAVGEQASRDDLDRMKAVLRQCIREGALGLSTTVSATHSDADGQPVPSRHATREEIYELMAVVSEYEGTSAEVAPGSDFNTDTYELMTQISLHARRPVNWNLLSIQTVRPEELERNRQKLGATDYARARGAEVVALTTPQSPTARINLHSGFMFDMVPEWDPFLKLPVDERMRRLRDPAAIAPLRALPERTGRLGDFQNYAGFRVIEAFCEENQPHVGRIVGEIAAEQGRDPLDIFLEIALADQLRTQFWPAIYADADSPELFEERRKLWVDDRTVIGGSDAGAHLDMIDSFAVPTAMLGIIRDYPLLPLEAAIQMLTQGPARLMGVRERGELREGWHADIVIFDEATVGQGATYTRMDLPGGHGRLYADAKGIDHVIVNGHEIIRDGAYLGRPAGKILRSGSDTYTQRIPADQDATFEATA